jgi:hypothetical protein
MIISGKWSVRAQQRQCCRDQQCKSAGGGQTGKRVGGTPDALRYRLFERMCDGIEVPRAVVADPIYEDRGRPAHSYSPCLGEIGVDAFPCICGVEITFEYLHVEADLSHDLAYPRFPERRLFVIESVMHLPEPALVCCSLGCAGGEICARMYALVREMPEDIFKSLTEGLAQPLQDGAKASTIRTEKVAVGNDIDDPGGGISASNVTSRRLDLLIPFS